jgi:uncharacterized protein with GYD domain
LLLEKQYEVLKKFTQKGEQRATNNEQRFPAVNRQLSSVNQHEVLKKFGCCNKGGIKVSLPPT